MNNVNDRLLRTALRLDAVSCGAVAVAILLVLLNSEVWLVRLDIAPWFLIVLGVFTTACVPVLWSASRRRKISVAGVWGLVASNAAWAVLCCLAVLADWIHPSTLGASVIVTQAVLTGVLAELEILGLRRAAPPASVAV